MKGLILAAGRGSRLGEHTADKPKCMVPLDGKPLLEWQIQSLFAAGIADLAVVKGYLPHTLTSSLYQTYENPRWSESNMVRSLECAGAWLESDTCIISYSDIVYHPSIVQSLIEGDGPISVVYDTDWYRLWSERAENPLADAETFKRDGTGRLIEIGKKPLSLDEIQGQYLGLIKCTPEGWALISKYLSRLPSAQIDKLDMTSLLNRLIEQGIPISTVSVSGKWCEVDSSSDLKLYEEKISGAKRWHHDWRIEGAEQKKGAVIWITGLSGAGKSTIAHELLKVSREQGFDPILLDGDALRVAIGDSSIGHDRESRLTNAMRICRFARLLSSQGSTVIVATMSLFKEVHSWNRENLSNYFEVYIRASLSALKSRDARGLYSRAGDGHVSDVVGVHLDYDEPRSPHLTIDNDGDDPETIHRKAMCIRQQFMKRAAGV